MRCVSSRTRMQLEFLCEKEHENENETAAMYVQCLIYSVHVETVTVVKMFKIIK